MRGSRARGLALAACGVVLVVLAACAPSVPYRNLGAPSLPAAQCSPLYKDPQRLAQSDKDISDEIKPQKDNPCWSSTHEEHDSYDLYTIEFDDQGWLAGAVDDPGRAATQLNALFEKLKAIVETDKTPLSLVLYTHGWHHSAAGDDLNVVKFRKLLYETVGVERALCMDKRDDKGRAKANACKANEGNVDATARVRRVVGIYVGWRGDSIEGPVIEQSSIWDRKLTAEKVALGSVQELYALLHDFWVSHACHIRRYYDKDCVDVRLLTIGHSFGGLITYRGLAPRLMTGVVERHRDRALREGAEPYAYGFGNLSVLINPAFEGTRFEALTRAASARKYEPGLGTPQASAQLPFIVIAQSKGDWATGLAFPAFRWVTTLFERSSGEEAAVNLHTVGWSARYITHNLKVDRTPAGAADKACAALADAPDIAAKMIEEASWTEEKLKGGMQDLNLPKLRMCDGLTLEKTGPSRPDFYPLWVVQTSKEVSADHNDYRNPHLWDFVRQLYYVIERTTDEYWKGRSREAR